MVKSAAFWDNIADKYAARAVDDEDAYQHKLKITQQYFEPDMDVFEFGCGTGTTALIHAPFVKHYTATDISPKMIEIAKSKLAQSDLNNLEFNVATLDDFKTKAGTYDVVLGLNILHLIKDYQNAIAQAYQMLKPGGLLVTSTACLSEAFFLIRLAIPLMQFIGKAPHVEFFARTQLEDEMEKAGFDIDYRWIPPKSKIGYFLVARKNTSL